MKISSGHALFGLSLSSIGYASVNTKCVHIGPADIFVNNCAEFVLTVGTETYGVRMPITAPQGIATIGTKYDNRRRSPSTNMYLEASPASIEAIATGVPILHDKDYDYETSTDTDTESDSDSDSDSDPDTDNEEPMETSHVYIFPTATLTTNSKITGTFMLHPVQPGIGDFDPLLPPTATMTMDTTLTGTHVLHTSYDPSSGIFSSYSYFPLTTTVATLESGTDRPTVTEEASTTPTPPPFIKVNDEIGPGINNIPIKAIHGLGLDGKKVVYPNKHGSSLCKKAKKCIAISKNRPVKPCIDEIQEKIHMLAMHRSNFTFRPLEPVACAPALDSKYCAFVELVPWQTTNDKNERLMKKMDTAPYRDMSYNMVPIGAISEGVDWIVQGKAGLCGQSLLPLLTPEEMGNDAAKHRAYVLKLDVNPGLQEMSIDVRHAYDELAGVNY